MSATEQWLAAAFAVASGVKPGGELYRNEEGAEVWRIRNAAGVVVAEDVASDHDAQWLADAHGVAL